MYRAPVPVDQTTCPVCGRTVVGGTMVKCLHVTRCRREVRRPDGEHWT